MKKTVSFLLAGAMCAGLLAGCGSKPAETTAAADTTAAAETTAAVPPHQRWPIFPLLFSLSISNQADSHHAVNICQRVQAFLGRLFQ